MNITITKEKYDQQTHVKTALNISNAFSTDWSNLDVFLCFLFSTRLRRFQKFSYIQYTDRVTKEILSSEDQHLTIKERPKHI